MKFPGGVLAMTGADRAAGLLLMAVWHLLLDELDACTKDADGEGGPSNLACTRTRTFARRKVLMVSTMLITGLSRIEAAYTESGRRRLCLRSEGRPLALR